MTFPLLFPRKSTSADGGLPNLEGRIPCSYSVLGLHAKLCRLPCYLWFCKRPMWPLEPYIELSRGIDERRIMASTVCVMLCCVASMGHKNSLCNKQGRRLPLLPEPCCPYFG